MLWWKLIKSRMTLSLAQEYPELAEQVELPPGVELRFLPGSDKLVASVPVIDLSEPFDDRFPMVEDAPDMARRRIGVFPRTEEMLKAKGRAGRSPGPTARSPPVPWL